MTECFPVNLYVLQVQTPYAGFRNLDKLLSFHCESQIYRIYFIIFIYAVQSINCIFALV